MKKILQIYIILIVCIVSDFHLFANTLEVSSMEQRMEPMTVPMQKTDLNGNICALIKVQLPIIGCKFEGNVLDYFFDVTEYWVYMSQGSKQLNIKCPGNKTCVIIFANYGVPDLVSKGIYTLCLDGWNDEKHQKSTETNVRSREESLDAMRNILKKIKAAGAIDIGPFLNGIAPISKDDKYAFIDKEGNLLTAFAYDKVSQPYYLENPCWEVIKDGKTGVIGEGGKLIVPCEYRDISCYNDLISASKNIKADKWGTISGDAFSKAKYDIFDAETGEKIAILLSYDQKRAITLPYLFPEFKHNKKTFIDTNYKPVFKQKFEFAYPFSENLAVVRTKADGWFIIDQNGDKMTTLPTGMIPYKGYGHYSSDGCFHEGLLAVEKKGKKGFINKLGEVVIPIEYDDVSYFSEELAAVATGSYHNKTLEWHYIDHTGKTVIEPTINLFEASPFKNGIAICEFIGNNTGNLWPQVLYDKSGKILMHGPTNALNRLYWYGPDCFKFNLFPVEVKNSANNSAWIYINKNFNQIAGSFYTAGTFFDEFTNISDKNGVGLIDGYGQTVYLSDL